MTVWNILEHYIYFITWNLYYESYHWKRYTNDEIKVIIMKEKFCLIIFYNKSLGNINNNLLS